jgi:hypothetical protein
VRLSEREYVSQYSHIRVGKQSLCVRRLDYLDSSELILVFYFIPGKKAGGNRNGERNKKDNL